MRWKTYAAQEADARLRAVLAKDPVRRTNELWLAEAWARLARQAASDETGAGRIR